MGPVVPPVQAANLDKIHILLRSGIADYLSLHGFSKCVLGLSGGIDSALVAAIACEAVGPQNVICVSMPSSVTSPESISDAKAVAANLGCRLITIPIDDELSAYVDKLAPHMKKGHMPNVVEENLQARIRANLLYALSNEHGWFVLNTSNKSEAMTGYGTLYGDMAGGYGVIADVPKTVVYALARHANEKAGKELIPRSVMEKAPTAELRLGQKDTDSLPPYSSLDRILLLHAEGKSESETAEQGFGIATVKKVFSLIAKSAHKRRMSPPCARVDANLYKQLIPGI